VPPRARPVASSGVSAPIPPPGHPDPEENPEPSEGSAAAALHAAFERLAPQGSDPWNFLAAFTHLSDLYGPDDPGDSALGELRNAPGASAGQGASRLSRIRQRAGRTGPDAGGATSELEEAMGHVIEAFRFLSARVRTLEERLARQDRPIFGPAWLTPSEELGAWVEPLVAHVVSTTPGGEVLHGDCGEGTFLGALQRGGVTAVGVEPRGGVALRALEQGHAVTIGEAADEVAARPPASLGGLVLSGMVDRLALHSLIALLSHSRRALAAGAPIVVVSTDPEAAETNVSTPARDLVDGRPLHAQTWELLMQRAGFVGVAPLLGPDGGDARFAVGAFAPE
jgi:hypothetical protein